MRDSQRRKVYRWEVDLGIDESPMSMEEVRLLADQVCEDFGRPPLTIGDGRGARRGIAYGFGHIAMPRFARTRRYVLHEVAHALHYTDPGHGPSYARFLAELYERYAGVPMRVLRQKATEHHVRWGQAAGVPKPLTREERRLKAEVKSTRAAYEAAMTALRAYRKKG